MDTKQVATKADILVLKSDILVLKSEISDLKADMKKLDTKLDKLQSTLDGFVGVVDNLRTDNIIGTHHAREIQIKVDDHEERLRHIESSKHAV